MEKPKMSVLNYIVSKLQSGLITFINAVTLTNRDLPYHDYARFDSGSTGLSYIVGKNMIDKRGSQSKLFVSKSTLVYATANNQVRFNDTHNVPIDILASTWYEFKTNVHQVFWVLPTGANTISFYFEGVLPEEARSPE